MADVVPRAKRATLPPELRRALILARQALEVVYDAHDVDRFTDSRASMNEYMFARNVISQFLGEVS